MRLVQSAVITSDLKIFAMLENIQFDNKPSNVAPFGYEIYKDENICA
jgi:hypothetical protein